MASLIIRKATSIKPSVSLAGYNNNNYISNSAFQNDTTSSLINRVVTGAKYIKFACDVKVRNSAVPLNKGVTGTLFQLSNVGTGPNVAVYQNQLSLAGGANVLTDFSTGGVFAGQTIPIGEWFRLETLVDFDNRYYETNVNGSIYRYSPEYLGVVTRLPNYETNISRFVSSRSGSANGVPNALRSGTGWTLYIGGVPAQTGSFSYANFKLTTDLGTATFSLSENGSQFFSVEDPAYYLTLTGTRG
jgi:hypothetical protein